MMGDDGRLGAWERQLLRRHGNPLFGIPAPTVDAAALESARRRDREEREAFHERFVALMREAGELGPNEGSERLLRLKARLEQAYTECAALAGERRRYQEALERLIEAIVRAVRQAAGPDPLAQRELEQEEQARRVHFRLLEQPLVADLMRPDSPVSEDDLAPTLLSEPAAAVEAALWLFGTDELTTLCRAGRALLVHCYEAGEPLPQAWARLGQMEAALAAQGGTGPLS